MTQERSMEPVQIEHFYLGCLAHASYMIGSDGRAAVIDPQRDVDLYIDAAAAKGWKIDYIIETHVHADFVSGHRELAERTGARICLGAGSGARFPHIDVKDGDEIRCGQCRLRFLQTPGHTLESICILMNDEGARVGRAPSSPATHCSSVTWAGRTFLRVTRRSSSRNCCIAAFTKNCSRCLTTPRSFPLMAPVPFAAAR